MPLPKVHSTDQVGTEHVSRTLLGTWRLVSWESHASDGTVTRPFGDNVIGYLAYTADGYVFVQMMRPGRGNFTGDEVLGGTVQEISQSLGFAAYGGTYEIRDSIVVHHVELSPFPNWPDGELPRRVDWNGDRLVLTTLPTLADGGAREGRLTWERVSAQ